MRNVHTRPVRARPRLPFTAPVHLSRRGCYRYALRQPPVSRNTRIVDSLRPLATSPRLHSHPLATTPFLWITEEGIPGPLPPPQSIASPTTDESPHHRSTLSQVTGYSRSFLVRAPLDRVSIRPGICNCHPVTPLLCPNWNNRSSYPHLGLKPCWLAGIESPPPSHARLLCGGNAVPSTTPTHSFHHLLC